MYAWYYLTVTVHKILFHGARVIESVLIPIVQLIEEAQERGNKDFKFINFKFQFIVSHCTFNTLS